MRKPAAFPPPATAKPSCASSWPKRPPIFCVPQAPRPRAPRKPPCNFWPIAARAPAGSSCSTNMAIPALPSILRACPTATLRTLPRLSLQSRVFLPLVTNQQSLFTSCRHALLLRQVIRRRHRINPPVPLGHQNPLQQPRPLIVQEILVPPVLHE